MVVKVNTVSFSGIDVLPVKVEVQIMGGMPTFAIVGLADKAVGESKERVRAALSSIGVSLPPKRITINLAPADIIKEGSHFDLPIALGLMGAIGIIPTDRLSSYIVMGELGLDGSIAPVSGILPAAVGANIKSLGFICPAAQGGEAAWSGNPDIIAVSSLKELVDHFKNNVPVPKPEKLSVLEMASDLDLKDIKGQESAKRALEIAAAGGHNLLMIGPPGAGKSMLAARMGSILPPLSSEEILEVSMIHSVAGLIKDGKLVSRRPFRDPHHSASMPAMVGGGQKAKPGEVSLAHKGILFLDELPEFGRQTLEALRQPLETGKVSVARASFHAIYPARFQLIAAMNPCKCGYFGSPEQQCPRAPKCAAEYQSRISGPLFDRIDMHIEVPAVNPWDMSAPKAAESSADVAKRVAFALNIQKIRYKGQGISTNAEADGKLLEAVTPLTSEGQKLLSEAAERLHLSARGYHRILRVARTIADLEGVPDILPRHLSEALSFRRIVHKNS